MRWRIRRTEGVAVNIDGKDITFFATIAMLAFLLMFLSWCVIDAHITTRAELKAEIAELREDLKKHDARLETHDSEALDWKRGAE